MTRTIINKMPDENGALDNRTGIFDEIPQGWLIVPENLLPIWDRHKPFVSVTVENDVITSLLDNPEARAIQEAADAEVQASAPKTPEEKIAELEVAVDALTIAALEG